MMCRRPAEIPVTIRHEIAAQREAGLKLQDIASTYGVSASTVSRLHQKWKENNGKLDDRPRKGAPKRICRNKNVDLIKTAAKR
jgi:transposase